MKEIKPFSAFYYMKQNKGRTAICIFMMVLATLMFLAGNYIHSVMHSFEKEFEYSDKLFFLCVQNTDEEYKDFYAVKEDIEKDEKLQFIAFSCKGFGGMPHGTVLGLEVGGDSFVFQSKEDMERVFTRLGIEADLSGCADGSIVLSKDFAKDRGLKLGDKVNHSFDECFNGEYSVDALIDDGSYCTYYIYEDLPENCLRLYVYSDEMEGKVLYDYVTNLIGGRNVMTEQSRRESVVPEFQIFYVLFYVIDLLIAVVLSVTVNSVMTGQYLKRTYEFGIYRAIGRKKKEISRKIASEILSMNGIAILCGFAMELLFIYLINELAYKPVGKHLLFVSKIGILGFVICDLLIIVPMILSNAKRMNRVDVTAF